MPKTFWMIRARERHNTAHPDGTPAVRYYGGSMMIDPWCKTKLAAVMWPSQAEAMEYLRRLPEFNSAMLSETLIFDVIPTKAAR